MLKAFCPICGGGSELKGGIPYCPSCRIFVGDTAKTMKLRKSSGTIFSTPRSLTPVPVKVIAAAMKWLSGVSAMLSGILVMFTAFFPLFTETISLQLFLSGLKLFFVGFFVFGVGVFVWQIGKKLSRMEKGAWKITLLLHSIVLFWFGTDAAIFIWESGLGIFLGTVRENIIMNVLGVAYPFLIIVYLSFTRKRFF